MIKTNRVDDNLDPIFNYDVIIDVNIKEKEDKIMLIDIIDYDILKDDNIGSC